MADPCVDDPAWHDGDTEAPETPPAALDPTRPAEVDRLRREYGELLGAAQRVIGVVGGGVHCPFHGLDLDATGIQRGLPRCESCRLPYAIALLGNTIMAHDGQHAHLIRRFSDRRDEPREG